jgi:hypothetical protein
MAAAAILQKRRSRSSVIMLGRNTNEVSISAKVAMLNSLKTIFCMHEVTKTINSKWLLTPS